jgi:hypothetical protein
MKTFVNDDTVSESIVTGDRRFCRCKFWSSRSGETQKLHVGLLGIRIQAPGRNFIGFIKYGK